MPLPPLDEPYLLEAARYIELNPVRAGITEQPEAYPWSSAHAHFSDQDDDLVSVKPLLDMVGSWKAFLRKKMDEDAVSLLQKHERTGRPLGSETFVRIIERKTGRELFPQKTGPKAKPPLV